MLSNLCRATAMAAVLLAAALVPLAADAASKSNRLNTAPTISGTPAKSVLVGDNYMFQATAFDRDGDLLKFTIKNKPAWATFNSLTGTLTGTPGRNYVGTYSSITIAVTDGRKSAALPSFSISVGSSNRPPLVTGTPVTSATTGQPYAFRPTASDPDGDPLTYRITNKPAWATFDATSGTLYGTPSNSSAGVYSSIVISASDGITTSSLPAFSISVALPPQANATLSWVPPTQNVDGTPLTDLAGFRVLYGQTVGQYTQTLNLPSPTMSTVVIEGLGAGTWYFIVKAVNAAGAESDFSNVVSKVF